VIDVTATASPHRTVVVLCGPPGAGKTTAAHASGLTVYDRDDERWTGEKMFRRALAGLRSDRAARAVVIRSGATSSARASACRLVAATHCFLLAEDETTLRERVRDRRRADFVQGNAAVRTWFEAFDAEDGVEIFPGWDFLDRTTLPLGATSRRW
jgi:shikimate kinase